MEFRPLDITVLSAKGLKDVNLMTKMDVYAVVSISGDPRTAQKTPVDKDCGSNPKWKFPMKFTVDAAAADSNHLTIAFKLMSDRALGDREVGEVHVPVKELLEAESSSEKEEKERVVSYDVRTPKGKVKGSLDFSYRFGEKFTYSAPPPPPIAVPPPPPAEQYPAAKGGGDDPMTAYPATAPAYCPAGASYAPPVPGGYPQYQPPQQGYGYPGYPPQGYGYPPQGYGYPPQGYPPAQQVKPPKKGGGSKLGLGLAGGLLGGLLIGDMIGDASEMAAYDAGFDDGLDF